MKLDSTLNEEQRRNLWNWARGQISEISRENERLEAQIAKNTKNIEYWKLIEKACLPNPCTDCSGHGCICIWEARDESHIETCKSCGGSGKAK